MILVHHSKEPFVFDSTRLYPQNDHYFSNRKVSGFLSRMTR
jgi:hypothetical protein